MSNDADNADGPDSPDSTEERELFGRLADDAGRARLLPPADLRRRGDRRTAVRAAVVTVAVVALVAGVLLGGGGLLGNAAPEPAPLDTPAASPSTSATPSPTEPTPSETASSDPSMSPAPPPEKAPPEEVTPAAWLGEDVLGFELAPVDAADVPTPCGRSVLQDDAYVEALLSGGTRQGSYRAPDTPAFHTPDGTITQTIVLMRDEQAADAVWFRMQEVVKDCPEETSEEPGAIRYGLVDPALPTSSALPDRHLLVEVSTSYEYLFGAPPDAGPDRIDTYVSVLRVGNAVTFLELRGWEASATDLPDVHRLAHLATARLLDWQG